MILKLYNYPNFQVVLIKIITNILILSSLRYKTLNKMLSNKSFPKMHKMSWKNIAGLSSGLFREWRGEAKFIKMK